MPDAWIDDEVTMIGHHVPFTRYFHERPKLRTIDEIGRDILALEQETEGLLTESVGGPA